ncbi:hypothetical protein ACQUZK_09000, partial [Streptococcus pyogenes]|uniref:hypothetical protein n=1 Tax=Streptococcus pyogenes TaxID=1314 RepID=UPI003DA142A3
MSEPATSTKPNAKAPAKVATKTTPSMSKASTAESQAMAQAMKAIEPKIVGSAKDYAGWTTQQLLAAGVTLEHEPAPPLPANMKNEHWQAKFTASTANHSACATKLKGARRDLWNWLGGIKALLETYDDPATHLGVKSAMEGAIKMKLGKTGMLPKNPNWRNLILPAGLFPEDKLAEAVKVALQKQMSVYRSVLRLAEAEGVNSTGLAAWIEERNGIERIRLGKQKDNGTTPPAPSAAALQAQAAFDTLAAAVRSGPSKLSFNVEPSDIAWNPDKDHPEIVLLATYHPTTK